MDVEAYIIAATGEQSFAQARRNETGDFDVEYRDGEPARHFATTMTNAHHVANCLADWLSGGPQAVIEREWTRLEL